MVDIVDVDIMDLTVEDIEQVVPSIRKTGTLLAGCYLLTKDHIMNQSDNRYIPNEIGSKSPENRSHRSSTKDGRTPSGLSTPLSSSDKVSTPISIELINGSDRNTGVNNKDSEFPKLSHHSDFTLTIPFSRSINPQKNFMVINDSHTPKTDKGIQSKRYGTMEKV